MKLKRGWMKDDISVNVGEKWVWEGDRTKVKEIVALRMDICSIWSMFRFRYSCIEKSGFTLKTIFEPCATLIFKQLWIKIAKKCFEIIMSLI